MQKVKRKAPAPIRKEGKLEQMDFPKVNYYDDFKIQNNGPKDRFVLYLEKKEKNKIEEKIIATFKKLNSKYKFLNKNIK